MSQNTITTTTFSNISSDESLNKLPLSSSQSTDGSDAMTTSDSINCSIQYTTFSPCPVNKMVFDQQSSLYKPTPDPQASSYSPSGYLPESLNNVDANHSINGNQQHLHHQQHQTDANRCEIQRNGGGDLDAASVSVYATNDQISNSTNTHNQQHMQQTQPYESSNSLYSTNNCNVSSDNNGTTGVSASMNGNQTNNTTYHTIINSKTYSPKSKHSVQSFHSSKQTLKQRYSITNFDTKSMPNSLMTTNIKGMLLDGVAGEEIILNWLTSIKCDEYLRNFIDNGYDMSLITKMTPQDLTAIGCKSPIIRKKLLLEIKKLNLEDDIPECRPSSLDQWLEILKLGEYYVRLCDEGYDNIDKVCELTWEDLEEIGITKLGHQKRLLLGIDRIRKIDKLQEERQNDYGIYDVHPNHRISLNQYSNDNRLSTMGRSTVRSGFFQTRSGANLDHRGIPVATVMPALKHVNSSLANLDISNQTITKIDVTKNAVPTKTSASNNRLSMNDPNNHQSHYPATMEQGFKMSVLSGTMKRTPPPLPPVRTNSLRIAQDTATANMNNANQIYGNNYGLASNGGGIYGPTSFLRTPKLGTLTATTNKMLTSGGHIQTLNTQSGPLRSMMPVREAPPPPPPIPENLEEESITSPMQNNNFTSSPESNPLIGHQLASADEFPPPPPSQ